MLVRRRVLAALGAIGAAASLPRAALAQEKTITVFAAASLKNALDEIDDLFTKQSGIKIVASFAASSALMKQIEQGAPADVFLSADVAGWTTAPNTISSRMTCVKTSSAIGWY